MDEEPGIKLQLSEAKAVFKLCQILCAVGSISATSNGNVAVNTCTNEKKLLDIKV